MDLQLRKINFVQEFLRLNDEAILNKLEDLLHSEKRKTYEKIVPMSQEELNKLIDLAEEDAQYNRVRTSEDLKKDIDKW